MSLTNHLPVCMRIRDVLVDVCLKSCASILKISSCMLGCDCSLAWFCGRAWFCGLRTLGFFWADLNGVLLVFLAVYRTRDIAVCPNTAEILSTPIQRHAGWEGERENRQEERHELHDHLLLRIHVGWSVPRLQLMILEKSGGQHDAQQSKIGNSE